MFGGGPCWGGMPLGPGPGGAGPGARPRWDDWSRSRLPGAGTLLPEAPPELVVRESPAEGDGALTLGVEAELPAAFRISSLSGVTVSSPP